jgi:hypothetical protein
MVRLLEQISLPNTREYLGLIWHMNLAYVMFFLPNKSPRLRLTNQLRLRSSEY